MRLLTRASSGLRRDIDNLTKQTLKYLFKNQHKRETWALFGAEKPRRLKTQPRNQRPFASVRVYHLVQATQLTELLDAIIAIKPHFAQLIAARKKNHEYRKYKLAALQRLWLYQTAPKSMIT